ncbi:MFS transporter [Clostridium rectalis]|uniref:MFS transporter n=1 Tax=Clostridium rectalis TaxID=2040295 RepID=UPI000F640D26|nr:MFS transporter [Clostridium rectalis]
MNIYRKNLTIMCGITFLTGLIFYGSIATIIRQHRGLSIYEIFILESIFTIAMLLFEIPWGYFADKFGYKKTLITSYILFLLSKIIFYKAYGFYLFLLEAIISSMALAGISGRDSALIYLSIGDKYSEKAFSKYNASNVAGFFIASLLSTYIIRISLDATIFYTILSYTLALVLVFFIEDVDYDKKDVSIRNSFYTLISNKNIVPFIVSMALISEATHSICIFLN